ncbi:hypothetical protein QFZ56_000076 [Streptomyces achromogenes]|uniref:Uncharacterized protein n=1 Tax=Streptomyces achromogenes TaxID=67255 RepID=A0ABU0PRW0_STRAH|nr:ANTAR domain-containing protein [Streptomyces achromogenes]MDQ0681113.1 hypothetical protein [Streptomyces achromogenes]
MPAEELERLRTENRQLQHALASHAIVVVDQAIGGPARRGTDTSAWDFTVLRGRSPSTNIKLTQVAEQVLKHGQGAALPDVLLGELHAALARHAASRPV